MLTIGEAGGGLINGNSSYFLYNFCVTLNCSKKSTLKKSCWCNVHVRNTFISVLVLPILLEPVQQLNSQRTCVPGAGRQVVPDTVAPQNGPVKQKQRVALLGVWVPYFCYWLHLSEPLFSHLWHKNKDTGSQPCRGAVKGEMNPARHLAFCQLKMSSFQMQALQWKCTVTYCPNFYNVGQMVRLFHLWLENVYH